MMYFMRKHGTVILPLLSFAGIKADIRRLRRFLNQCLAEHAQQLTRLLRGSFSREYKPSKARYPQLLPRKFVSLMSRKGSLLTDMCGSLKTSLVELGFDVGNEPSWETCDEDFKSLQHRLESSPISDLIEKPFGYEPNTVLIGTVITEAISAAYWSDALLVRYESWLEAAC